MEWEYYIDKVKPSGMVVPNLDHITVEALNMRGKNGWELLQIVPLSRGGGRIEQVYFYWRREISEGQIHDADSPLGNFLEVETLDGESTEAAIAIHSAWKQNGGKRSGAGKSRPSVSTFSGPG